MYWDAVTATYYDQARYYNPVNGRFTQEDTNPGNSKDPLSLNLYLYCANNPVRYYDSDGHLRKEIEEMLKWAGEQLVSGATRITRDTSYRQPQILPLAMLLPVFRE